MLEEELLRVSGALTGHRYLFGLVAPGGLTKDLSEVACGEALRAVQQIVARSNELERKLRFTSSFLDRLEEVGFIPERNAMVYGLVGPIARASGLKRDLRKAQPYDGYENIEFEIPVEQEGDGYARLHPVRRGKAIGSPHGTSRRGFETGANSYIGFANTRRSPRMDRSSARCGFSLDTGRRKRNCSAVPHRAAFFLQLARLSSECGELRFPRLSDHLGDDGPVGGGKRSLRQERSRELKQNTTNNDNNQPTNQPTNQPNPPPLPPLPPPPNHPITPPSLPRLPVFLKI